MKTIDLKKYYHDPELYDESNLVVVTDEVAEVMDRSIMEEKSFYMRRYRAKAFYSLDYGNGIEHYVIFREESPEELYEKKTDHAATEPCAFKTARQRRTTYLCPILFGEKLQGDRSCRKDFDPCGTEVSAQRAEKAWGNFEKIFLKVVRFWAFFVSNNERQVKASPQLASRTLTYVYPTFQLHKACLAATHGATASTDGNTAKIPRQRGGEISGDGGAIRVCRHGEDGISPMQGKDR